MKSVLFYIFCYPKKNIHSEIYQQEALGVRERAKKSFVIHRLGYEHETKVFETKNQVKIEIIKCLGVYEFCAVSSYPDLAYIEQYMKSGW